MKLENAKAIVEFLEDDGIEARLYEGYSGRGMYGTETAGVVTDDQMDVGRAMGALGIDDSQRLDSLGLSIIVY